MSNKAEAIFCLIFLISCITFVVGILGWMCFQTFPISQRLIRGKYINNSLGSIFVDNNLGYLSFRQWDGSRLFNVATKMMIHSTQIEACVKIVNKRKTGDRISGSESGIGYRVEKGEDVLRIGCQILTYKEAKKIVAYLKSKGSKIEDLQIPE